MTKKERIYAAVRREKTDELPFTFWTHLPGIDLDPVKLADATFDFYREYDVDLVKTMNNGMYSAEDFGCVADYSGIASGGVAKIVASPIETPADWGKIVPAPLSAPALSRELFSLSLLIERLRGEEVPVIFTVFSPLTTADKISRGLLLKHIALGQGEKIKVALEAITQTTRALVREAIRLGADGVFLASQLSSLDKTDEATYRAFGEPYDRAVLEASDGFCDTIHAHGENIMFDILKSYPVDIFNWHVFETAPTLNAGASESGRCVLGGLKRADITARDCPAIKKQVAECLNSLGGIGQILAPGCVIRYPLDSETLKYIRTAKREVEQGI